MSSYQFTEDEEKREKIKDIDYFLKTKALNINEGKRDRSPIPGLKNITRGQRLTLRKGRTLEAMFFNI